jgi:hypothetical protein
LSSYGAHAVRPDKYSIGRVVKASGCRCNHRSYLKTSACQCLFSCGCKDRLRRSPDEVSLPFIGTTKLILFILFTFVGGFKNGGGREREKEVSHDVPVVSVCWSNRATSSEFVTTHIFAFSSIVRLFIVSPWSLVPFSDFLSGVSLYLSFFLYGHLCDL